MRASVLREEMHAFNTQDACAVKGWGGRRRKVGFFGASRNQYEAVDSAHPPGYGHERPSLRAARGERETAGYEPFELRAADCCAASPPARLEVDLLLLLYSRYRS